MLSQCSVVGKRMIYIQWSY